MGQLLFFLIVLLDRAAWIGAEESERVTTEIELDYLDQIRGNAMPADTTPALV